MLVLKAAPLSTLGIRRVRLEVVKSMRRTRRSEPTVIQCCVNSFVTLVFLMVDCTRAPRSMLDEAGLPSVRH